jgi:hypothetical protein
MCTFRLNLESIVCSPVNSYYFPRHRLPPKRKREVTNVTRQPAQACESPPTKVRRVSPQSSQREEKTVKGPLFEMCEFYIHRVGLTKYGQLCDMITTYGPLSVSTLLVTAGGARNGGTVSNLFRASTTHVVTMHVADSVRFLSPHTWGCS